MCESAFGYSLGAVAGSEEGKCLHLSLCSLVDAQAGKGTYANPNARKVSPEELTKAQATWRNFLTKLLAVIRSDSEQFRAKNGVLDTERNFGHALIQLSVSEEAYGDAQLISEIHQVLIRSIVSRFHFTLLYHILLISFSLFFCCCASIS